MDDSRFDSLTKHFASAVTRRTTLGGVAAGLLTAVGLAAPDETGAQVETAAKPCLKNGKRCGRGTGGDGDPCRRCCSGYSKKRQGEKGKRCTCAPQGKRCKQSNQCCGNQRCEDGRCTAPGPNCAVCPNGCDFETVQAAIDAADAGDTIRLCARTYPETLTIDKDLTLVGAGETETTIQATGTTTGVFIDGAVTVELRALTITGATSTTSGGGIFNNGGDLTLANVTVSNNTAAGDAGGIHNNTAGATLTLDGCTVSGNTATSGAGGGGIYNNGGTVEATDSVFANNTTTGNDTDGAGIYSAGGTLTLDGCTFNENTADRDGGGVYSVGATATATVTGCTFTDNVSTTNSGAGLYNQGGGTMTVTDCEISGGQAGDGGGGIYNNSSALTVDGGSITDNHCDNETLGGGIHTTGSGATLACTGGTTFSGNTAGDPTPQPSDCEGAGCDTCVV